MKYIKMMFRVGNHTNAYSLLIWQSITTIEPSYTQKVEKKRRKPLKEKQTTFENDSKNWGHKSLPTRGQA